MHGDVVSKVLHIVMLAGSTCVNELVPDLSSGRIGCAYHDPTKGVIYVLEDTEESSHFDLTKMREHSQTFIVSRLLC